MSGIEILLNQQAASLSTVLITDPVLSLRPSPVPHFKQIFHHSEPDLRSTAGSFQRGRSFFFPAARNVSHF